MSTTKKKKYLRMFVLNYEISIKDLDKHYKGCAVVKANDAGEATSTFKSQSAFNGYQKELKVGRVEEIYPSPNTLLCCEEYVEGI